MLTLNPSARLLAEIRPQLIRDARPMLAKR